MAQINNGKLNGEAIEDFDTPEEDPDIKGNYDYFEIETTFIYKNNSSL